ncbi:MAG: leucine-rich repeat domain-containing protein [Muribaculaceae bacterium]|nr:leucine-rich repeat domain-containing protein [Muribaculaceae bacterium]
MIPKKLKYLLMLALVAHFGATAQQVTFGSAGFDRGVKIHLGLDSTAVVQQSQTDTITGIDLSGMEIDDLRDVVYLPNVRYLNLAYNDITDVWPLTSLDSLHYLDLRGNKIRDINLLAMSTSDSMEVNLAYNYITNFDCLCIPSYCKFQIVGMAAQTDPNAPYIHANDLHVGFNGKKQYVYYRGDGNQPEAYLTFDGKHVSATLDSITHGAAVPTSFKEPGLVWLRSDDVVGDSIWVIPCKNYKVEAGESLSVDTQLPFNYSLYNVNAMYGGVTVTDKTIIYTAPANPVPDQVGFVYYQGTEFRGFGRILINNGLLGDLDCSGIIDVEDVNAAINIILKLKTIHDYPGSGDMDGNGYIDVEDINAMINIILKL